MRKFFSQSNDLIFQEVWTSIKCISSINYFSDSKDELSMWQGIWILSFIVRNYWSVYLYLYYRCAAQKRMMKVEGHTDNVWIPSRRGWLLCENIVLSLDFNNNYIDITWSLWLTTAETELMWLIDHKPNYQNEAKYSYLHKIGDIGVSP